MKNRNIWLCLLFTIISFGIYGLYWYCSLQNQIQKKTGLGFSGGMHFLLSLVTFGIYPLYWSFVMGKRLQKAGAKTDNGIWFLILTLVGLSIVAMMWMQNTVNNEVK